MNTQYLEKENLHHAAIEAMKATNIVVDIGCGIMPQNYIRPHTHICCEPYQEYVEVLQNKIDTLEHQDCAYIILKMGWQDVVNFFPAKSVDTVFLVDVIEHLEKEEGQKLLALTDKIAREQIIIFTPLGFMPQYHEDGKDAWGLNGADWQEHKSGWLPEDFGDDWQCLVSKEYHTTDNLQRPLETPYGALWAIKTFASSDNTKQITREESLKNIESKLRERESELNSLFFTRVERKLRRILKRFFKQDN